MNKIPKNLGRKIGSKSLALLGTLFHRGARTIADLVEVSEYDEFVREKVYKQLWYLERGGYIKKKKSSKNASFFHLTPKGRLSFLKYFHLEKLKRVKWDGQWRVIIFDIPEKLKKWREFLRPELKALGFVVLQESVYLTPHPVTKDLDRFLNDWNLRKYVRYLTVTEIDNEDEFKEKFSMI